MGLLDIFTGQPAIDAAEKSRALLQQTQQGITDRTNATAGTAAGYLNTGFGDARTNLGTGYGASTGAINQGAGSAINYLDQGAAGARDALGQARTDLTANGGAYAPLSALAGKFDKGADLYADATGVNGAEGNTRATGAFQAGPGYQFTLDQGLNSINRAANARGAANSGNTDVDALKYGTGLANNTYQQWVTNLSPYNNLDLSATQGAATGNQANNTTLAGLGVTEANLANTSGQNKAQVASQQGGSLSDLARSYYGGLGTLDTAQGGALASNATNANSAINGADMNLVPQIGKTYQDAAAASLAGSKNILSAGMGLASLAAGGMGGMGSLSSLGSMFGGGANPIVNGATYLTGGGAGSTPIPTFM